MNLEKPLMKEKKALYKLFLYTRTMASHLRLEAPFKHSHQTRESNEIPFWLLNIYILGKKTNKIGPSNNLNRLDSFGLHGN